MVSFKNFLLFCMAALSATAFSTLDTVLNDVTAIDTSVKSLIKNTAAITGLLSATTAAVLEDLGSIYSALSQGDVSSGLLPLSLSESDAWTLITYVNHTLAIDNPLAVETLESKKLYFQEAGMDGLVVVALEGLKGGHDLFSANVLGRIPADTVAPAKEVIAVIDNALQGGIDAFSAM